MPILTLEPGVWWMGVLAGLLLAWAADAVVFTGLDHITVPEAALAACIVAGVAAFVLLVAFILLRYMLRFVLFVVEVWGRA